MPRSQNFEDDPFERSLLDQTETDFLKKSRKYGFKELTDSDRKRIGPLNANATILKIESILNIQLLFLEKEKNGEMIEGLIVYYTDNDKLPTVAQSEGPENNDLHTGFVMWIDDEYFPAHMRNIKRKSPNDILMNLKSVLDDFLITDTTFAKNLARTLAIKNNACYYKEANVKDERMLYDY